MICIRAAIIVTAAGEVGSPMVMVDISGKHVLPSEVQSVGVIRTVLLLPASMRVSTSMMLLNQTIVGTDMAPVPP